MRGRRANVLFIDHVPETGGGQILLHTLLGVLRSDDYGVAVACHPDGPVWQFCAGHGIPTYPHWIGGSMRAFGRTGGQAARPLVLVGEVANAVRRLRRAINAHGAHVVHCNSNKDCLLGGFVGRLTGRKVVWQVNDMLRTGIFSKTAVGAMRTGARLLSDRVVGCSQSVTEVLREEGFSPARIRTVVCAVSPDEVEAGTPGVLRRELSLPPSVPIVGILGRLTLWKGQHVFLQAAARLAPQWPAHFAVIGGDIMADRGYRAVLESMAHDLGVRDRVTFTGHRADRLDLLQDLDVLVHASVEPEPFGLVLVEAMLAGKPVIATDAGGAREIVVREETGLLTPPGDVDALAAACSRLLSSPEQRTQLGRRGRERALRLFSPERMARDVERVYDELLCNNEGTGS